jgi:Family of unknown function (DUF6152)
MKKMLLALIIEILMFSVARSEPAFAHHSQATYTDANGAISITGVVKKFEFTNPHSFIYLEVAGDGGAPKLWALEMQSVTHLKSIGWTNTTVKVGDSVTAIGRPAKNGAPAMYAEVIKLPDGRQIRS